MNLGIIFGFIFLLGAAIAFLCAGASFVKKRRAGIVTGAVIGLIFALLLVTIPASFHTVEAGEIAVVKHSVSASSCRRAGCPSVLRHQRTA